MASGSQPPLLGPRKILRACRVIHPFPTLANVVAVFLFALVAWHGLPPWSRLLRLLLVMLFIQSAIGAANDAYDVDLDRLTKPWKPIVAGALSRRSAGTLAGAAAIAACIVCATLGFGPWLAGMGGLACGLAYDAGLKRTPFSVATYLLALPLLPIWIWSALGRLAPGLLWEYPLGVLVGAALYLGNTAPDIDSDVAAGVTGAAHQLGTRGALLGGWICLALALALGPIIAVPAGYQTGRVIAAALMAGALLLVAVGLCLLRPLPAVMRIGWGLMIAASLLFAVGWLSSAP